MVSWFQTGTDMFKYRRRIIFTKTIQLVVTIISIQITFSLWV